MKSLAAALFAFVITTSLTFAEDSPFVGTWSTDWGILVIKGSEEKLTGKYSGPFVGTIEGKVTEGEFHFVWKQTNAEWGSGVFTVSDEGKKLIGTWGGGESKTNGGPWTGTRE
ncbi:MAG: hypothetical protein P1U68_18040 [Verrucomicrobiales bacterium]|nr:hypothetical protein [Verrucomicrobiales bacterium]